MVSVQRKKKIKKDKYKKINQNSNQKGYSTILFDVPVIVFLKNTSLYINRFIISTIFYNVSQENIEI